MQLDFEQTAATTAKEPRVLVVASAGSGKTRSLIERIAWLIETQKVSPSEIMSFSYTRKASGEIRDRLIDRIGNRTYGCHVGTQHSLALQFIHRFGEILGLRPANVTVYGEFEEGYLFDDVAQEMSAKKPAIKDAKEIIERYYRTGTPPEDESPGKDLFNVLMGRFRENNSLSYGGLLIGLKLLIPTLAKYLHIRHVLVDECQDLTPLQWEIVNEMCAAFGASLYAVGDIDQSIYSFRGAVPEYLLDHQSEFTIYKLESNYRSVPSIVEASNRLIAHNQDRIEKTMRATREGGSPVRIERNADSNAILGIIGAVSASKGDEPEPLSGICVLARTHRLLGKIDRLMEEAGIPHTYLGKTTALTNSEPFRRFHAFLKLAVNNFDNFSFLLIRDIIGLSREEYGAIRLEAVETGRSHFQVFAVHEDYLRHRYPHPILADGCLSTLAQWLNGLHSGLSPEAMAFINQWLQDGHKDDIQEYLDWLALYEVQDEIKEENQGIILSTIHGAKGLEWPVVIIAGCNEGIIPGRPNDPDEIESERRLFYVAMTRARDQLIITVRPTTSTDAAGRVKTSPESRFVAEAMG